MKKFLSIIVPHFKESEKDMFPLLSGLYSQLGVDFRDYEVIIVTDGGGTVPNADFLKLFAPMDISLLNLEKNGGPGLARQAGIDAARGQYLMFCDADDCLHSIGVLDALTREAESSAADIVTSNWLEQFKDADGGHRYLTHNAEVTWMHGKLIRRAFIEEHGIRHHPNLRVHEDSYFLSLASAVAARSVHVDVLSYVWKFRDDSITRRNNKEYSYKSFPAFIYACCEAMKWIEERNRPLNAWKTVQLAIYVYFSLHLETFEGADREESLKESERAFVDGIRPFWPHWIEADPATVAEVYNAERQKHFAGKVESETLGAWLDRIGLEKGERHGL